jgi:hypothetical protein
VNKVTLGQVFSEHFGFPCQSSFHQTLHPHNHQSQVCTGVDKSLNFPICGTAKEFFLDGLKKLEQRSRKCVELTGEYVE